MSEKLDRRNAGTVVVTRAREQAAELDAALAARGLRAIPVPAIRYAARNALREEWAAVADADYRCVAFTSPTAVRFFCAALERQGMAWDWDRVAVAAVGPGTARAAEEHGVRVDFVATGGRGRALATELLEAKLLSAGDRVLLPQGSRARPELSDRLRAAGVAVDALCLYATEPAPREDTQDFVDALRRGDVPDAITFASPSAVDAFLVQTGEVGREVLASGRMAIVVIGPTTAEAVRAKGLEVAGQANEPTMEALAESTLSVIG